MDIYDGSTPQNAPFSATATGVLFNLDTAGMGGAGKVTVQVSGTFVGTVAYETSTDRVNWLPQGGNAVADGALASTDTGPNIRTFGAAGRYFRARCSAYTSGTITANPQFRS